MVEGRLFRDSAVVLALVAFVLFAAFGSGASAAGGEDEDWDQGQEVAVTLSEDQAPVIPEKQGQKYANLGSHLDRLAIEAAVGQASVQDAAGGAALPGGGRVAVTIYLSGNVDGVVGFLEDNGGDPRNVGEDYIEAYVPVALLGPVSEQADVTRVREIVAPEPDQSRVRVAGHGPPVHGSAAWNQAGYAGRGVKVGIIDGDFRGFSSLMGTDLPSTVVARCYTDIGVFTQNLADCEAVGDATVGLPFPECDEVVQRRAVANAVHGTIVAEALIDIAPEVSLYIANPQSWADMQAAVEWMASEGVTVINQSQSWRLNGPGDGTSPHSSSPLRTVDLAVARDITWVNAAGNAARNTWFGAYADPDGDRAISFAVGANDEVLDIPVRECRRYTVQLRWEDTWNGASKDLDLYLYDKSTGEIIPTITSEDEQSGESGHVPFEGFAFWSRTDSDDLGLVVRHSGGDTPDWIQLMVWGTAFIERYTKSGSIGNPSESANPGMLAVGAAHWDDVRAIEPYSSRGPTPDGRVKPDVVGADCGATALVLLDEYNEGFCGTSQAAPHVAGMAALVRQRIPAYTPAEVVAYLKDIAQQRQDPDPNNTWGHGFVQLPPTDRSTLWAPVSSRAFTRSPADEFNTLEASGNAGPVGIWSDGMTMWVADWLDAEIYAYDMVTKARAPGKEFNTLEASGNTEPRGIWSDGTTMWVADWLDAQIYAYDMVTKERVPGKEFNTLEAAGNIGPQGIWSDGTTMWVADLLDDKVYAYDMATRARVPGRDFDTLKPARNASPRGIWSDGMTMWVADSYTEKVYAYDMATRERIPGREFNTLEAAGNWEPHGIWSDGMTMWVADRLDDKVYAYFALRESAADKAALIAFYNATAGASWTNNANWLTSAPIGQWHGVTADDDGRVTDLYLRDNQLRGEIPSELGNLSNLRELILSDNQLAGPIPTWLGSLANLEALYLADNQLTGEIPSQLGNLSNLRELVLSENQLAGPIPTWLGSLANLEVLYLSDNQLTGEIPTALGNHSKLRELVLWGNRLTGAIPTELRSLAKLTVLSLSSNQLSGPIPSSLGSLANLEELYLSDNQLSGLIPSGLASLANLQRLFLSGNQLIGCIPAGLRGVADDLNHNDPDNDLGQLGLEFCGASGPGAPTVSTAVVGTAGVRLRTAILVTATFSEPVNGFDAGDVAVANADVGNFVGSDGASVYAFDVTPNAIGVVTVDIAAGMAEDSDGEGNAAAEQLSLGLPYDDDRDGAISRDEVIAAITDYLFNGSLARDEVIAIITRYLFG